MTIIVEDGTIVDNANSYVSELDLIAYALVRGVIIASEDAEELLIKSMDYVESLGFKGIKIRQDQSLQWPRASVVIDSYLTGTDEIPDELVKGLNETALSIQNGEDPLADIARLQKGVSVGSISVEYQTGSSVTVVRKVNSALRKLLVNAPGGISFEVKR